MELIFFIVQFAVPLLGFLAAVLCVSTLILLYWTPWAGISGRRLLAGYTLATIAALAVAAWQIYMVADTVEPGWRVRPENFVGVLWGTFKILAAVLVYCTLLGLAIVGAPLTVAMTRRGFGSVAWIMAASIGVSLAFVLAIAALCGAWSMRDVIEVTSVHLIVAFTFSLGPGLPLLRARGHGQRPQSATPHP